MDPVILILAGIACLVVSGALLYKMVPRAGADPASDTIETALALGQFSLMIVGIALIAKAVL